MILVNFDSRKRKHPGDQTGGDQNVVTIESDDNVSSTAASETEMQETSQGELQHELEDAASPVAPNDSEQDELENSTEISQPPAKKKERTFVRGAKAAYSLEEKEEFKKVIAKCKADYDEKRKKLKPNWNPKKKTYVTPRVKGGYLATAIRQFYPDLRNKKYNDPEWIKAKCLADRCCKMLDIPSSEDYKKNPKKTFREPGGGRKKKSPEFRSIMFQWFIDTRFNFKARVPREMFRNVCKQKYQEYLKNLPASERPLPEEELQFSDPWIAGWMEEFGVSLKAPNKRFSIHQDDRKERCIEYIKNVHRIRYYFIKKFGVDPPLFSGDQMPLHRCVYYRYFIFFIYFLQAFFVWLQSGSGLNLGTVSGKKNY